MSIRSSTTENLVQAALGVREHAYAPYSAFSVGAALLASDGQIYTGTNVENASYGLTICAERSAIAAAVAAGQTEYLELVVASPGGCAPCGACRQVLAEFCDELPIYLVDADRPNQPRKAALSQLLPETFRISR